ncbi:MAG: hypothetical protein U1E63_15915 [Burkholderiales bacterium]
MKIELRDPNTSRRTEWHPGSFVESGPNDAIYEFDAGTDRVTFGNGVNGRIPPAQAQLRAGDVRGVRGGEKGAAWRRTAGGECRASSVPSA